MLWIPAAALLLLGTWISLMNWACVVQWWWLRVHSSLTPVLGGALGAAGCWLAPDGVLLPFWWLPLLFDLGSAPSLAAALLCFRLRGER